MENKYSVLFLDDESSILNSIRRSFRKEDFDIITVENPKKAVDLLDEFFFKVIVTDYRMPEMNGLEFLEIVKQKSPGTIRVILSGYADSEIIMNAINKNEVYRFITKPWNNDELKFAVRQCIEKFDLIIENKELFEKVKVQNDILKDMNKNLILNESNQAFSLELFKNILNSLYTPVICINKKGKIGFANKSYSRIFKTKILGLSVYDLIPEDISSQIIMSIKKKSELLTEIFILNNYTCRINIKPIEELESWYSVQFI